MEGQAALIGTRYKIYRENSVSEWELFDLLYDPSESKNISQEKPELVENLKKKWDNWKVSVDHSAKGNDYNRYNILR